MIRKVAFTMFPIIDVVRARKFYEETLGLTLGTHGNQGDRWWLEYDLPDGGCVALSNFGPAEPAANGGTLALEVDDLDTLMAHLEGAGVRFQGEVVHGPNCRMALCNDSEGNPLLLHQLNAK